MQVEVEKSIVDLEQACKIITSAQTELTSWYGPAGHKLMNARAYLEKTYLDPLVSAVLADEEAALETAVTK